MFKLVFGKTRPGLGKVCLYLSLLGIFDLVFNTVPTVLMVHYRVDRIEWDYMPWGPIFGVAGLNLVMITLSIFGIALLNPLVVSIGLMFALPFNAGKMEMEMRRYRHF